MNTYIVTAKCRRVRAVTVNRAVVVAENPDAAMELVKGFYGPDVVGWRKGTEFAVEAVIPENSVKFI